MKEGIHVLEIAYKIQDLDFSALMDVYIEENQKIAAQDYPDGDANEALLQTERGFYQYLNECFFTVSGAICAVWKAGGKTVSALRLEPYQDGWLLEALETAPEERQKGYAAALVQALTAWCRECGRIPVYSHISKKNKASLRTHEKCSFIRILEHAVEVDGSVYTSACTMKYG